MGKKKKAKRDMSVNKSEFIRARPTAKIAELVEAAAAEGISITPQLIHSVRWAQKQQEALHPPKVVPPKAFKPPKPKNGVHVKAPPVLAGNITVEDIEAEWKGLDEAAVAMLGASIGAAVKKIVRDEVRAEVRRIMGAGVET